jgi:hypothetical protein
MILLYTFCILLICIWFLVDFEGSDRSGRRKLINIKDIVPGYVKTEEFKGKRIFQTTSGSVPTLLRVSFGSNYLVLYLTLFYRNLFLSTSLTKNNWDLIFPEPQLLSNLFSKISIFLLVTLNSMSPMLPKI